MWNVKCENVDAVEVEEFHSRMSKAPRWFSESTRSISFFPFTRFRRQRCEYDVAMAEIPFADVEELPAPMAASVSNRPRDRHSSAVQCLAGAHTELGDARHLSRSVNFPTTGSNRHQRNIVRSLSVSCSVNDINLPHSYVGTCRHVNLPWRFYHCKYLKAVLSN